MLCKGIVRKKKAQSSYHNQHRNLLGICVNLTYSAEDRSGSSELNLKKTGSLFSHRFAWSKAQEFRQTFLSPLWSLSQRMSVKVNITNILKCIAIILSKDIIRQSKKKGGEMHGLVLILQST